MNENRGTAIRRADTLVDPARLGKGGTQGLHRKPNLETTAAAGSKPTPASKVDIACQTKPSASERRSRQGANHCARGIKANANRQNLLHSPNGAIGLRTPLEARCNPLRPRDQSQRPTARTYPTHQTKPPASECRSGPGAIHCARGIKANAQPPELTPLTKRSHRLPTAARGQAQSTAPEGSKPTLPFVIHAGHQTKPSHSEG